MSSAEERSTSQGRLGGRFVLGSLLWAAAIAAVVFVVFQDRRVPTDATAVQGQTGAGIAMNAGGEQAFSHEADEEHASQATPEPVWPEVGVMDFELTERSGRTVTKDDLLGRPWAVCFVFTRCAGPCPRLAGQMRILQDKLQGTDVQLVTITVDPEYDTPEVMQRFAKAYNADSKRWWFLTGDKVLIYEMITKSFQMPVAEASGSFLHSNNIMHVNAEGRVVGKYNGLKEEDAAALYRALKQDAGRLSGDTGVGEPG